MSQKVKFGTKMYNRPAPGWLLALGMGVKLGLTSLSVNEIIQGNKDLAIALIVIVPILDELLKFFGTAKPSDNEPRDN